MPEPAQAQNAPLEIGDESLKQLSAAMNQAAERSQAAIQTGLRTWESEIGRYFEEFGAHSRETLDALGRCEGPMDVLNVEQQWLQKRAQAYLESGMRFARAFADVARGMGPPQA